MDELSYRVHVGLNYPPARRAEPDDIVSDLPAESVDWLLARGAITPVAAPKPAAKPKPVKE